MKTNLKSLNPEKIISEAKSIGASAATVFPVSDIKFDLKFRTMCENNLCGNYGRNYTCPPFNGNAPELIEKAKTFETAVLIQTIHPLEDSYDFEGMTEGALLHDKNIRAVKKYIEDNIEYKEMLALGAGGCKLCEKCGASDNTPCKNPGEALSSVEGYCMDVADMTNSHGLKYINGKDTVSYAAVFLLV